MWEVDHKEGWVLKNWCSWTVVLEKTPESPLDCKGIQPVHPKGNQSWIFIGRTDAEAEAPFGHLMWRANSLEKTLMLESLKAGGEGDNRGWDGWMASLTQWIWIWANSGRWWWKPGVLQSTGSQRVGHDWESEPQHHHHHGALRGCTLNAATHVLTGERWHTERRPCQVEAEIRVTLPGAEEGKQRPEGRKEAWGGVSWSPQKALALLTPGLRYLASRPQEDEGLLFSAARSAALGHSGLGSLLHLPSSVHRPRAPSSKTLKPLAPPPPPMPPPGLCE